MPARAKQLPIRVADVVIARLGSGSLIGRVLEDRGQLGPEGGRVFRIGWTPSQSEEELEIEVSADDLSLAIPRSEWNRALARIDEFSHRSPVTGFDGAAMARALTNARLLLDTAFDAVYSRGKPKDFELVHRRCVEDLGPTALKGRRVWTDARSSHGMPTLDRLPAMIESEVKQGRHWLITDRPLNAWQRTLWDLLDELPSTADQSAGGILLAIVGHCADLAAWIRCTHGVGE